MIRSALISCVKEKRKIESKIVCVSILFVRRKLNMQYTGHSFEEFYYDLKGSPSEIRNCNSNASRKFSEIFKSNLNESQLSKITTLMYIENLVKLKTWFRLIEPITKKQKNNNKKLHKESHSKSWSDFVISILYYMWRAANWGVRAFVNHSHTQTLKRIQSGNFNVITGKK